MLVIGIHSDKAEKGIEKVTSKQSNITWENWEKEKSSGFYKLTGLGFSNLG